MSSLSCTDAPEDIPNAAPPDAALSQPCHKDHEQQNGRSSDEKHLPETRQAELQRGTENPGKEEVPGRSLPFYCPFVFIRRVFAKIS